MNKDRRDKIRDTIALLSKCESIIEQVLDKEQDCMDNYPENFQCTEVFEKMEIAVDNLNDASDNIAEAKELLKSAME